MLKELLTKKMYKLISPLMLGLCSQIFNTVLDSTYSETIVLYSYVQNELLLSLKI